MYALFHGQDDLKNIAKRIHSHTKELADKISKLGHEIVTNDNSFFDTIVIKLSNMSIDSLKDKALKHNFNLMYHENGLIGISLDEKTDYNEVEALANLFDVSNDSQNTCLLYTSPSPRDRSLSRMPSSA